MQTSCSGITCHGSPGQPAKYNTDFFNPPSGQTIEQVLMGKTANYTLVADPTSCPSDHPELLINPTAPSESLILKKIKGTQACGVRMPNANTALSQAQIDCFVDWVNSAAGKSGGTGGAAAGGTGPRGGSSSGGAAAGGTGPRGGSSSGGAAAGGTGPRGGSSSGGASARGGSSSGGTGTRSSSSSGASARGGSSSGGSGAGGASTGSSSGIPPTFDTVKTILSENVTSCIGSDCHGGHPGRLNLLLNDGLLGRLTSSSSELCGMPIVDPGHPSNSAIVKVLREGCGTVTPNCMVATACIPRMPIGCTEGVDCISDDYMKALEQWITDGAKP